MDFANGQIVLVDTNVIIEAHRTRCWNALAHFFRLETVEKCVEETQTGFQNRCPEQNIDGKHLRGTLKAAHVVTEEALLTCQLEYSDIAGLDDGEKQLMTHAMTRNDTWLLASPDIAAMRFACARGWKDRLVSLESMARRVGAHLAHPPGENYTEAWLSGMRTQLILKVR